MEGSGSEPEREDIQLRDVEAADLPAFFEQQQDPEANRMAAFTTRDPANRDAFAAHWDMLLGTETVVRKTILHGGRIAGHVLSFEQDGRREVTYWLGKEHWGRGVATAALQEFLRHEGTRPLYARAAKDNVGSIRVLQKCGFEISGEDKGFSNARGEEVEEFVLVLRGR
jgi:RimJ/RimL family protein N-acetyltransferase